MMKGGGGGIVYIISVRTFLIALFVFYQRATKIVTIDLLMCGAKSFLSLYRIPGVYHRGDCLVCCAAPQSSLLAWIHMETCSILVAHQSLVPTRPSVMDIS